MAQRPRVLAVGLGNMGYALAGRVAAARYPCWVHDLRPDVVARHAAEHGTEPAPEPLGAAAAEAGVVLTCVPNTDATQALVRAIAPSLRRGTLWVDATSGRAADARALAAELSARYGVGYADVAVSGGPAGARKGALAALVGGDDATARGAMEVAAAFAPPEKIFHCGPPGSGHAVKAANNALLATSLLASGEAIGALAELGIDPAVAAAAISQSSGRSWATMQRFPEHILPGKPYDFAMGLLCKDVDNAVGLLGEGREAPLLAKVREMMRDAEREVGATACHCDAARVAARRSGADPRPASTA